MSDAITRVDKPWGHELIWAKTDRYVGKILHIEAGHVLFHFRTAAPASYRDAFRDS